mgnify:FL=1
MASNLNRVMRWYEAVEYFNSTILPSIRQQYEQDGIPDIPARSEEWNNWTDSLCKSDIISDWQYANWSQPKTCEG